MLLLGAFFLELLALFLISRWVVQRIYFIILLLTTSRMLAVTFVTVILFPGTVIHELSHLFTAEVLGVRTGKFTVVPESIEKDQIRAGSVQIVQTDPFRRYLIGLAPMFTGIIALVLLASYFPTELAHLQLLMQTTPLYRLPDFYLFIGMFYLFFVISNSMFSSKEDLAGFIPFLIVIILLIAAGYIAGLRFAITGRALEWSVFVLASLTKNLGFILALNIILLLLLQGGILLAGKVLRRKIVQS